MRYIITYICYMYIYYMCVRVYIYCMNQVFDKNLKNSDLKIEFSLSVI